MGKRGNGEGSITRRKDGLYMACYTVQMATGSKRKAKARGANRLWEGNWKDYTATIYLTQVVFPTQSSYSF